MAFTYPHLKVRVPEKGTAILTTVELDGNQIPALRVAFDTGADLNGQVKIMLEFIGTIDLESEAPLTLTAVSPVRQEG